jgi:hypothetical protein
MLEFGVHRIARLTREPLDGSFGCDRGRKLVVTLLPNDLIEIKPYKTQRPVRGVVMDLYRYLVRRTADAAWLEKARSKKARKAQRLARQRLDRTQRRLLQPLE